MPYKINMFKLYEKYPHKRLIHIHLEMDMFISTGKSICHMEKAAANQETKSRSSRNFY